MRVSYLVVALSLVLTTPASCAIEGPGDLTGIYEGELHFPSHSVRITATLVQTQDQVAGWWSTVLESASGTITGSVIAGSTLDWKGIQMAPCPGALKGVATIKDRGAILEGPYTITNCRGTTEARFSVARQLIVRNGDQRSTSLLGLARSNQ